MISRFLSVGTGVVLDPDHSLFSPQRIHLGNHVFIGDNAYLAGSISVQDNVMISRSVTIVAGGHLYAIKGRRPRFIQPTPECIARDDAECIVIEDDCWIGAQATLVGDLRVGMGAVIGAGSVVTRDIPPYVVAAGNPCRPIKRIFDETQLAAHLCELGYPPRVVGDVLTRRANTAHLPFVDHTDKYTGIDIDYILPS